MCVGVVGVRLEVEETVWADFREDAFYDPPQFIDSACTSSSPTSDRNLNPQIESRNQTKWEDGYKSLNIWTPKKPTLLLPTSHQLSEIQF